MKRQRVVRSSEEVVENIRSYAEDVVANPALAARLGKHSAWYAVREVSGDWIFGPSKFVGYHAMKADDYLAGYDRRDGRESEATLRAWFERVEPGSALDVELREAFTRFASHTGRRPSGRWRVSILKEELALRAPSRTAGSVSSRIDFHPEICGGRPRIAGTRVRVSDIIAALGAGETIAEILVDFPYLEEADIYAALDYAAKAVDHRILRAA